MQFLAGILLATQFIPTYPYLGPTNVERMWVKVFFQPPNNDNDNDDNDLSNDLKKIITSSSSPRPATIEEEQKTLMSGLDLDINLCQDLMSRSHVRISCRDQMCIFQLDFPCLLLSISQYLAICIYHCPFQFDFPFLLRSISQNWNSAFTNAFLGWIS